MADNPFAEMTEGLRRVYEQPEVARIEARYGLHDIHRQLAEARAVVNRRTEEMQRARFEPRFQFSDSDAACNRAEERVANLLAQRMMILLLVARDCHELGLRYRHGAFARMLDAADYDELCRLREALPPEYTQPVRKPRTSAAPRTGSIDGIGEIGGMRHGVVEPGAGPGPDAPPEQPRTFRNPYERWAARRETAQAASEAAPQPEPQSEVLSEPIAAQPQVEVPEPVVAAEPQAEEVPLAAVPTSFRFNELQRLALAALSECLMPSHRESPVEQPRTTFEYQVIPLQSAGPGGARPRGWEAARRPWASAQAA